MAYTRTLLATHGIVSHVRSTFAPSAVPCRSSPTTWILPCSHGERRLRSAAGVLRAEHQEYVVDQDAHAADRKKFLLLFMWPGTRTDSDKDESIIATCVQAAYTAVGPDQTRSLIMVQSGSTFSQIWRACKRLHMRSLRIKTSTVIWFVITCAVFCRGLALTSFSHWSISIGSGSKRVTMIPLLGPLSQATTAFRVKTFRRMPLSLGKRGKHLPVKREPVNIQWLWHRAASPCIILRSFVGNPSPPAAPSVFRQ